MTTKKTAPLKKRIITPTPYSIHHKIVDVILHPTKFFINLKEEKGMFHAFLFFFIFSILLKGIWRVYYGILEVNKIIVRYPQFNLQMTDNPYLHGWLIFVFLQLVTLFAVSGLIHMLAIGLRGKGTYFDSFKLFSYTSLPVALFGFIFPGIFGLWSIALLVLGIGLTYEINILKSLISVLVPLVMMLIFTAIFILVLLSGSV